MLNNALGPLCKFWKIGHDENRNVLISAPGSCFFTVLNKLLVGLLIQLWKLVYLCKAYCFWKLSSFVEAFFVNIMCLATTYCMQSLITSSCLKEAIHQYFLCIISCHCQLQCKSWYYLYAVMKNRLQPGYIQILGSLQWLVFKGH